jgi:CheY-like chemotaxis protein
MKQNKDSFPVLHVLSLEDSTMDFAIIRSHLEDVYSQLNIERAIRESDFTALLLSGNYDIILADFNLPGFDAFGALEISRKLCPHTPFIVVSGAIGEETAIELLKQGAVDFIMKDKLERLGFVVERALDEAKERIAHKKAQEELEKRQNKHFKLSEQVPGVIYQYRLYPDGRSCFPYSSSGMNFIYECTPEEVREDATPVFGRIHPDDRDKVSELILESAANLSHFYSEFRVILPRQGLRWRYSDAVPEMMEDKSVLWHGIIYDITRLKEAESDLNNKMDELIRFHNLTVDREIYMIDLKKEVNDLLSKLGQPAKYRIVE